METTQQELTAEERHDRLIAFLKRHTEEKRRAEAEMVEKFRTDERAQAIIDRLKQQTDQ